MAVVSGQGSGPWILGAEWLGALMQDLQGLFGCNEGCNEGLLGCHMCCGSLQVINTSPWLKVYTQCGCLGAETLQKVPSADPTVDLQQRPIPTLSWPFKRRLCFVVPHGPTR